MSIYKITVKGKDPRDDRTFLLVRPERKELALVWVALRYPHNEIIIDEVREPREMVPMFN